MAVETCEICGAFTRGGHAICSQCWVSTREPEPCVCGHDSIEHFPDYCNHFRSAAVRGNLPVGCSCTGFKAAS